MLLYQLTITKPHPDFLSPYNTTHGLDPISSHVTSQVWDNIVLVMQRHSHAHLGFNRKGYSKQGKATAEIPVQRSQHAAIPPEALVHFTPLPARPKGH